eukprot:350463-Chlamydomonas_euryale.AAC.4
MLRCGRRNRLRTSWRTHLASCGCGRAHCRSSESTGGERGLHESKLTFRFRLRVTGGRHKLVVHVRGGASNAILQCQRVRNGKQT